MVMLMQEYSRSDRKREQCKYGRLKKKDQSQNEDSEDDCASIRFHCTNIQNLSQCRPLWHHPQSCMSFDFMDSHQKLSLPLHPTATLPILKERFMLRDKGASYFVKFGKKCLLM